MRSVCSGADREHWGEPCPEPALYMVLGGGVGPYAESDRSACAYHAREALRWSDRKVEGPDGEMRLDDDLDELQVVS